ncbi:hypothetical protein ARMSODRAFT_1026815 [Armillaria solidipes]|uniref:Uncharacterized protein n=1 Tax=Armillaria solidipes TaxID=1076256 RepID=A0A2H3AZA1_9AGAR|nr:hypothetical protein ARMSODRAFT_1026815 [Armillaria solidipes]
MVVRRDLFCQNADSSWPETPSRDLEKGIMIASKRSSSLPSYSLYVNGDSIGSGNDWRHMQEYSLPKLVPDVNVVAVDVADAQLQWLYLAAKMLIAFNDGTSEMYSTDESWKTLEGPPPAGFEQPDVDDSKWSDATVSLDGNDPVNDGMVTFPDA